MLEPIINQTMITCPTCNHEFSYDVHVRVTSDDEIISKFSEEFSNNFVNSS